MSLGVGSRRRFYDHNGTRLGSGTAGECGRLLPFERESDYLPEGSTVEQIGSNQTVAHPNQVSMKRIFLFTEEGSRRNLEDFFFC